MQPIPCDVRQLHIFKLDKAPRTNKKGYADKKFTKSDCSYRMYFRSMIRTVVKDAQGLSDVETYKVVINGQADISLGDRVGKDSPEFEVTALLYLKSPIQYQLEVKRI